MKTNNCFRQIVGTGGIGVGMLFLSEKMETLGRSESRPVILSKARDFCKQHIVLYYSAALTRGAVRVIPIGFVGDDAPGRNLLMELGREGMDVTYVGVSSEDATMISVCLQYPDREGCNFTATNNAARCVTPEFIQNSMDHIGIGADTIVAAIPEVPVESRVAMIRSGKGKGAFTALSIPVAEAGEFLERNIFASCDFLAVNEEEAQAILGKGLGKKELASCLYEYLVSYNSDIKLLVTCGKNGAYTVDQGLVEYTPPLPAAAVNTTGAGDAFLGGTLAGLAWGLPFQKHENDTVFGQTRLSSAAELGALCAGMAVEVEDSIGFNVTPESIQRRIQENRWEADPWFTN